MLKIPKFLCPKHKCEIVRLGRKNDGGYSVPKNSLLNSKVVLGFGLSDDWSFEEDFQKNSKTEILCYDHSVNLRFWIVKFIKDFINIVLLRKKIYEAIELIKFFKYLKFFRKENAKHEKKYIAPINQKVGQINESQITDLNEIIKTRKLEKIFLKVDIEGSEYRILDQIIAQQNLLTGMVIEFHDCDLHYNRIEKFVEDFSLQLVHLHVNNFGIINENDQPTVLELTFAPSSFNTLRNSDENKFPIHGLDQPNDVNKIDENIKFE